MLDVVLAHTSSYPLASNYIGKTFLVAFARPMLSRLEIVSDWYHVVANKCAMVKQVHRVTKWGRSLESQQC